VVSASAIPFKSRLLYFSKIERASASESMIDARLWIDARRLFLRYSQARVQVERCFRVDDSHAPVTPRTLDVATNLSRKRVSFMITFEFDLCTKADSRLIAEMEVRSC